MTNLTESSVWESGVFQLETDTPTLGGVPGFDAGVPVTGHANAQALQLANRTKWLNDNKANLSDLANPSDPTKGPGMVGFSQDDPLASASTLQIKVRRSLELLDWPVSTSVGVNNTPLIQAALNKAALHSSKELIVAGGIYGISGVLTVPSGIRLIIEEGSGFEPNSDAVDCLRAYGSLPSAFYALLADAGRGTDRLNVGGVNAAAFAAGDYIWISDTAIILTSPNTNNLTQAQQARVVKVESGILILDRVLQYTFTALTATVGVMDAARNITIEGLTFHDREYAVLSGRAVDFRYGDNIKVYNTHSDRSRSQPDPDTAYQVTARSAITLRNVSNCLVEGLRASQVAWYGVDLDGASHFATIRDINVDIARHGVSLNWNGPGEPIDVLVENLTTSRTTYGGGDTHDVGRDITFRKIKCVGALNDGFQIRTSNVRVEDVRCEFNGGHGVLIYGDNNASQTKLQDITLQGVRAKNNAGRGITSVAPCNIIDARIEENGSSYHVHDKAGIATPGGRIEDSYIAGSNGAAIVYFPSNVQAANQQRLLLRSVIAPASVRQDVFLYSTVSYEGKDIRLRDVVANGYAYANRIVRAGGTYLGDIDERGCSWVDGEPRAGAITLVAGTATISNGHVRANTATTARDWRSSIRLQRLTTGGTVGSYTVSVADGSFTITSSSNTDTSRIQWIID